MSNKYFECKMCDKKYNIGLCWLFHAIIKHHYEPVKSDLEAIVYDTLAIIFYPFVAITFAILIIIKCLCYPFWWIYERI